MDAITVLGGQSKRFSITDVLDADGTPVTSGATVTINLYDGTDALVVMGSVQQRAAPNDNTYYTDITLPTVTRISQYVVKGMVIKTGQTWKDEGDVWVTPS
jgi:hypothetical protein